MNPLLKEVLEYLKERGWDKLRPSDLAKSISIEAAELLEIFQWSSNTIEEVKADPVKMNSLQGELADVTIYAIEMAVLLDLDIEEIVRAKLEKVRTKYPADLMKKISKEGSGAGTEDEYLKIKKAYRQKEDR